MFRYDASVGARIASGQAEFRKGFSVILNKPHGTFVTDRRVKVGMELWDDCRACEEFADCHKLCTTQLALESAVRQL